MAEHTVEVWDKPCTVSAHQESKSVWVAVGDYMGESIKVEDRSERTAVMRWCNAARYKGNCDAGAIRRLVELGLKAKGK